MRYNFKNTALLAIALAAEQLKAEMGYVDAQTLLDDAHAYSATAVSTNAFDTLSATNDIGPGTPIVVEINVDVALAGTTPTCTFDVISSAAAALSSPTVLASVTPTAAQLVTGYKFYIYVPQKTQRYVGLRLTLGGTTPTITVTASVKPRSMVDELKYYPVGYVIG